MAAMDLAQVSYTESPSWPAVATASSNADGATTEHVTMLMLAHQLHEEHVAQGRAQAEALVADARRAASDLQEQMQEEARRQRDVLVEQARHTAADITAAAREELGRLKDSRDAIELELSTLRDSAAHATRELERLHGRLAETRAAVRTQAQMLFDCAKD